MLWTECGVYCNSTGSVMSTCKIRAALSRNSQVTADAVMIRLVQVEAYVRTYVLHQRGVLQLAI